MRSEKLRLWLALVPAMLVPYTASLFYFVIFTDSALSQVFYATAKLFTIIWPVLAVSVILRQRPARIDITAARHIRAVPLGLVIGIAVSIVMLALMRTPFAQVVTSGSEHIRDKAQQFGIIRHYWLFALFLSLIHSLIEEYYWRWFVFGRLRTAVGVAAAHLPAALAFASHHVVVMSQFFGLFRALVLGAFVAAGGFLFSLLYDKQKTLTGAWACHLIIDLAIMSVGHKILFETYL